MLNGEERVANTNVYWEFASSDAMTAYSRRRDFGRFLRTHGTVDSDYDGAELIFAELVGNVIRHAPGEIRLRVEWQTAFPTLHVHDRGCGFTWQAALPPNSLAESRRGLFIVQTLSADVRVRQSNQSGTRVSALLPVERRAEAAVS